MYFLLKSKALYDFQCDFLPLEQILFVSFQAPVMRYVYR